MSDKPQDIKGLSAWLPNEKDGDLFWRPDRNATISRPKSKHPKLAHLIFRLGDWVERQGRKIGSWSDKL